MELEFERDEVLPPVPSNYSDEELVRYVEHYFPNLNGALKELLTRFDSHLREVAELRENSVDVLDVSGTCNCPSCGSRLKYSAS